MYRLLLSFAELSEKHAGKLIVALLLSAIPTAWLASQLVFRENFGDLLPDETIAVQDLDVVAEKTGGTAFIVVAIDASDVDRAKRFAAALEPRLEALENILYVEGRIDVDFIKERQLLYLSSEELETLVDDTAHNIDKRLAGSTGIFVDLEDKDEAQELSLEEIDGKLEGQELPVREHLIGNDGKYLYVFVRLKGTTGDLEFGRAVLGQVQAEADALRDGQRFPKDLELRYTGSVVIRIEDNAILQQDLRNAGILGFLAVVLLISGYTRSFRTLVLVSVPLLVGIAWTFAFARLAIGHLNLITGFLTAVLFGLGIDFTIHMFLRYVEGRRRGQDVHEATRLAMVQTGPAVLGGAITTAAAFFMVRFAHFKGYNEFGLLAAVGILLMLLTSLLCFAPLNLLLERVRPMRVPPITRTFDKGLNLPAMLRWLILAAVPLFCVFSIREMAVGDVGFKTNWRELKGESPASDFDDYMIESLGQSFSLTLVLLDDRSKADVIRRVVDEVKEAREAKGLKSGVTNTVSLADLVPPDQDERKALIDDLRKQLLRIKPETLSKKENGLLDKALHLTEAEPFTVSEVPISLKQRFETADGKGTLMVLMTDYLFYELDEAMAWADEMQAIREQAKAEGVEAHIMSENWIVGTVFKIMLGDGPYIVWSAFLAIFVVLLIDSRSITQALIVLTPLAIGIVSIAGVMALLGMQLNFMNGIVIPSAVGIGIDNAIHVYHRYKHEGPGSIPLVLRHSASATMLTSMTTMLGFGAMIVAHQKGIRSVGELALIAIGLTYFSTSIFFPLALGALEKVRGDAKPADPQ